MGPQISVIRGILIPADDVERFHEAIGRVECDETFLSAEAPNDRSCASVGDSEFAVVVGAPVGPRYGHDYGVLMLLGGGPMLVNQNGHNYDRLICTHTDDAIREELLRSGFECQGNEIETYVVCWFG